MIVTEPMYDSIYQYHEPRLMVKQTVTWSSIQKNKIHDDKRTILESGRE